MFFQPYTEKPTFYQNKQTKTKQTPNQPNQHSGVTYLVCTDRFTSGSYSMILDEVSTITRNHLKEIRIKFQVEQSKVANLKQTDICPSWRHRCCLQLLSLGPGSSLCSVPLLCPPFLLTLCLSLTSHRMSRLCRPVSESKSTQASVRQATLSTVTNCLCLPSPQPESLLVLH